MSPWSLAWSPDGGSIALAGNAGDEPDQIWLVGNDGHGLRRLTSEGANDLVGWTPLAPVLPPAGTLPASEQVLGPDTVATEAPVAGLAADGSRVALVEGGTPTDCEHVGVWTPGETSVHRLGLREPCSSNPTGADVELAGSRAAWVWHSNSEGECNLFSGRYVQLPGLQLSPAR